MRGAAPTRPQPLNREKYLVHVTRNRACRPTARSALAVAGTAFRVGGDATIGVVDLRFVVDL